MRDHPSPPEARLWWCLRDQQLGTVFKSQVVLYGFIGDFYAPALRLLVEVDGRQHETAEARAYDYFRDTCLAKHGIRTIRFTAQQVFKDLDGVVLAIAFVVCQLQKEA